MHSISSAIKKKELEIQYVYKNAKEKSPEITGMVACTGYAVTGKLRNIYTNVIYMEAYDNVDRTQINND